MQTVETLRASATSTATFTIDAVMPEGAWGIEVVSTFTNKTGSGSYAVKVSSILPDGTLHDKVTSAAITGNGTSRLLVHPAIPAAANLVAQEVMGGKYRLTYTKSADGFDIAVAVVYHY